MVTPFSESGEVDFYKINPLIDYLLKNGTDGLIVAGTTGESPTLTSAEKVHLFRHVVKVVNNRVPVIAGTGSNNTKDSIALTKEAEASGVDGILLVTPYYNKPNQEGLFEHFSSVAQSTKLPIMLYNIPGRSVINMDAETVIKLSKIHNIVSIKEAGLNMDQLSEIVERTNNDFSVYSGNDSMTLPMLSLGATGVVSVASHVIGNEMKKMIKLFFAGKVEDAAKLHHKLLPIMNGLFAVPSPTPVKTALNLKGVEVGSVRLPLIPLSDSETENIKALLKNIG